MSCSAWARRRRTRRVERPALALLVAVALLSGCGGGGGGGDDDAPWSGVTIREPTESDAYSTQAPALFLSGVSFLPATYACSLIGGSLPVGYEVSWRNDANGETAQGKAQITCFPFVLVTWTTFLYVPLEMGPNPITVTVSSAIDNRVGSDTITVTRLPDTTPPTVSSVSPAPDAVAVPLSADVVVGFDEIIDTTALDPGQVTLVEVATATSVPLSFVPSLNRTIVATRPTGLLTADTLYEIRVSGITDAAGNVMAAPFSSRFRTATVVVDDVPPTVVALDPPAGAVDVPVNTTVVARFSEPVDFDGLDFYVRLYVAASGEPVTGPVSAQEPVVQATFYPDTLAAGTTYRVEVFASDLAGNPMSAPFTATFTTAP